MFQITVNVSDSYLQNVIHTINDYDIHEDEEPLTLDEVKANPDLMKLFVDGGAVLKQEDGSYTLDSEDVYTCRWADRYTNFRKLRK